MIFRIAGIGLLISVMSMVLKQAGKEEQAQMLTLAGVVIGFDAYFAASKSAFASVRSVFDL